MKKFFIFMVLIACSAVTFGQRRIHDSLLVDQRIRVGTTLVNTDGVQAGTVSSTTVSVTNVSATTATITTASVGTLALTGASTTKSLTVTGAVTSSGVISTADTTGYRLKSPNGTWWRIIISNTGTITTMTATTP